MIAMKKLTTLLLALCLTASMAATASAAEPMEYSIDGPGYPEYGKATSIEVVHTADGGAMKNEDVSKNAAMIPPTFGSVSADTPGTGTYLTPNLAPATQVSTGNPTQWLPVEKEEQGSVWSSHLQVGTEWSGLCDDAGTGAIVNGTGGNIIFPPSADIISSQPSAGSTATSTGYTKVTSDLYYSGGHLGTLKIPAIGLTVKVYEGTGSSTLAKGAGHFEETSIWDGRVALAAHNRGVNNHFGQIHTLELGDKITLTTKLGTRTYEVISVSKVSETDRSGLAASTENLLTLYTCVRDQRELRWCVTAAQVV